jgi:hypothetical protein
MHSNLPAVTLATRTKRIKLLMQNWSNSTIDLGDELKQARDAHFPQRGRARPGWVKWLRKKFHIHPDTASKFIRVSENRSLRALGRNASVSRQVLVLPPVRHPESARDEVARHG